MQIAAAILFFYVFGLAAIALTYYIGSVIWQEIRKKRGESKRS